MSSPSWSGQGTSSGLDLTNKDELGGVMYMGSVSTRGRNESVPSVLTVRLYCPGLPLEVFHGIVAIPWESVVTLPSTVYEESIPLTW